MFYHRQCTSVVNRFKEGLITKEAAFKELQAIEENAYRRIPDAEPDGDITYAVAVAVGNIEGEE